MLDYERNASYVGFLASILGHATLLLILLGGLAPNFANLERQVVYSISLEGGKSLGGMSQVPKNEKDQMIAPPKKVSGAEAAKEEEKEKAELFLKQQEQKKKKEEDKKKAEEEKKKKEAEKKKLEEKKKAEKPNLNDINKRLEAAIQRYQGESTDAGGQGFGAGVLGGNKMGGGVQRPPAFFTYRDLLKNHIKSVWRWFDTSAALIAEVKFSILPDGTLEDVELVSSSGNSLYDDSVVRAVYKASPVPQPPPEVYEQFFKTVTMRFDPRE